MINIYKQRPYANGHSKHLIVPSRMQIEIGKAIDWMWDDAIRATVNGKPVTNITVLEGSPRQVGNCAPLTEEQIVEIGKAFGVPRELLERD